jgi:Fe-S-cluster-containing dehydrogenase component
MTQYAMVIDLQKCVGCGACAIACKTENNTQNRQDGQSFNWADFLYEEEGSFPNTMHNHERCIGDRACQRECPYSKETVKIGEWSVLSFNAVKKDTHPTFRDRSELVAAGTASGAEIAKGAKSIPPHRNRYGHSDYMDVRRGGVVEKCIFCDHRLKKGEMPYCVVSCPSGARIFGDIQDPKSEPAKLMKKHKATVLKPEEGTSPNVYYIRSFKVQG